MNGTHWYVFAFNGIDHECIGEEVGCRPALHQLFLENWPTVVHGHGMLLLDYDLRLALKWGLLHGLGWLLGEGGESAAIGEEGL